MHLVVNGYVRHLLYIVMDDVYRGQDRGIVFFVKFRGDKRPSKIAVNTDAINCPPLPFSDGFRVINTSPP